MAISDHEALTRVIEHREIFHDEMLTLMRRIMAGEMSPVMASALLIGLRVKKETIPDERPSGMQAWMINLRREKFQDVRVREAFSIAFDFEWANQNLFYGQYTRSRSYFNNSEMEAKGLPSEAELALLDPLPLCRGERDAEPFKDEQRERLLGVDHAVERRVG